MWRNRSAASLTADDHLGMGVAGGADGDPRHEVEEAVAVHVLDHRPAAVGDGQRVLLDVAGRGPRPRRAATIAWAFGPGGGTTIFG